MPEQILLPHLEDSILTITLNRPEKRNALSEDLLLALRKAIDLAEKSVSVRVIVLAGSGKAFCSGHDLSEMTGKSEAGYTRLFELCTEVMDRIQCISKPVIARVHGVATAAGCQLVASCDLAVASTDATFATPGVKIGLFCTTPMVAVSRAIGRKRALEMLLTGKPIDASTAYAWGLVNRVVPSIRLFKETMDLAREIAQSSAYTVGLGKQAFYRQIDLEQTPAYTYARQRMTENALAHDAQEGITAFLEKRPAHWENR